MNVVIRRGTVADAANLAQFAALTFTQTFAADNTAEDLQAHLDRSYGEAQQRRELQDADLITMLAVSDDALIGFAQIGRRPPPGCVRAPLTVELMRFYVVATAHGGGVAQRLMSSAFEAARELGAQQVWLGVWERNPRAIAFYHKCGFRDVGSKIFVVGADTQTDRVLLAPVPPP